MKREVEGEDDSFDFIINPLFLPKNILINLCGLHPCWCAPWAACMLVLSLNI